MVDQLGVGEFSLCDEDTSIKNFKVKEKKGTLHVMIGLPGSGKNTYLAEKIATSEIPASALILSRDDIRVELGFCTEDEKIVGTDAQEKAVTKLFNERLNEAIKVGRDIVVNNINLSEKRRKALKNQCPNYEVVYWYVEAPTLADNLRRREGQIGEKVFDNMISNFDFPQLFECNILNIFKQSKEDEL
jgi:predicted kinase